jgi:pimeloyl-ACP methyl ester carboxylesterase
VIQHHFIQANRIRLHYVTQGEGDLVILLHGFPEFWYSWRYQIPVLARNFKVVVPDLRGYNQSDKPATGYDLSTLAADINSLIENLGYKQAHIVGHDFGGAIAWQFAQKFPHMLNRLVILSAPHPSRFAANLIQDLNQLRRSWYIFAFQIPGLPEWLIQQNLKNFVQTVFRGLAVRKGFFTRETSAMYEAALRQPGAITSALNYYRQLFSPLVWMSDIWSTMSSGSPQLITAPTLVLWGEEDGVLSGRIAEDLRHAVSASFELKFLPNCGHWIQQESPQTVNRELLAFFGMSEEEN